MINKNLNIIILAAGKGKRMNSNYPKVLHTLGDKPILQHVIDLAKSIHSKQIYLIYNHKYKLFKSIITDPYIIWIKQKKTLGTGNAIYQMINILKNDEDYLILYGDMPLISNKSIKKLIFSKKKSSISLLTAIIKNPEEYGRVIREKGKITKIIEFSDATKKQLKIHEINSGIFIASGKTLKNLTKNIKNQNTNKEYYITDIIYLAYQKKHKITAIHPIDNNEIKGINNKVQLSIIEKLYQQKKINNLLLSGVTIYNPSNFNLKGTLKHGKNIEIDYGVILEGHVILGNSVKIGPGCVIKDSIIGNNCSIKAYTIMEKVTISNNCIIGPFSHLRHGTILKNNTQIGNFVEIKETIVGHASKIKHLSYLGNSKIGKKVNIGAGTIFCNYDGKKKSNTIIGNNVFIGSNCQLVAPITIANDTVIAAGTTVIKNVKEPSLVYNKKKEIQKKIKTLK
ncbi:bifunctional UDP-N-acetylglucosamine diphosphorylase/glucosamine-1-phosphate N-acetyltransferase GlmU [Buchnera aphidicola]|uniref:Bifunctional protein GlmU n=1 Tax=Buchnera aphidicola subsp. Melaphis rhois TaxID=118103 RepID=A0A4D6YA85_BUCMH|nr:bifunctional UDP-N-acetylglucosamine diphosphorylase/glucosamine-1-phosphate N-acetyltransferase GlmU [Buchnera aphidicola]QCI23078.1 UDP-N-acetylglucosamine diphosphorylase/glucosamine-1-phosphate N-acetyltransferase [Buchnera aphidicola (Melaphis rhois)]